MKDHFERRPENREIYHDRTPPMPAYLPTEDSDNPHSTPLRHEQEHQTEPPDTPPEPDQHNTP